MQPTQLILIVVIIVLTLLLCLIGFQVYLILKEVKESVRKMNKMLDDGGVISGSIASLVDRVVGASGLAGVFGWLVNRNKRREEEKNVQP